MIEVEICCNSVASAIEARAGGATRIELCRQLECGGLTPADNDIDYCARTLGLRTHVLVRPRAGDFCYTADEADEMLRTICRCRRLGAAAVVVGALTRDGAVDMALTRRLVQAAEGMEVTFHRAFDEARQAPLEALEAVIATGSTRLLTSGQAPTAPQGAGVVAQLVRHGGIRVLAGSGVTAANVARMIADTGVCEVHSSCKRTLPDGQMQTAASEVRALIAQTRMSK